MDFAKAIKEAVSTRDLCRMIGLGLDRHGNALCPFHGDTNKSLKVYKDPSRGWACFGCHRGGTVIDFAMLWYGISYKQAVVRLDADFNLNLPLGRKRTAEERREARQQRRELEEKKQKAEYALFSAEFSFWTYFDRYCELLSIIETNRPKRPSDAFSDEWANAIRELPEIRDGYERAQYALEIARKEVEKFGGAAKARAEDRTVYQGGLPERRRAV